MVAKFTVSLGSMDKIGGSTPGLSRRGNHGIDSGNHGNHRIGSGKHGLDSGNHGNHGLDSGNHGNSGTKDSFTPRLKCYSVEFDSKGSRPSTPNLTTSRTIESGDQIFSNCCSEME